jgi:hypothetical protein
VKLAIALVLFGFFMWGLLAVFVSAFLPRDRDGDDV